MAEMWPRSWIAANGMGSRLRLAHSPRSIQVNRLQKKCFIASAGFHLLLAVILLIGPGFLPSKNSQDDLPLLDFRADYHG